MTSRPSSKPLDQALAIVRAGADRAAVAGRLHPDGEERLLQSIVDATVRLFDAEAASIALFERDPDRLEFKVAAGPRGAGAIGKSVKPSQGIAGFVFSSGQALALSDVASDPRFDRKTAEKTGYVPRSIAAVPLTDEQGTQASSRSSTSGRPPPSTCGTWISSACSPPRRPPPSPSPEPSGSFLLLRSAFARATGDTLTDAQLDALVSAASEDLDTDEESPYWALADQVARLRGMGEAELSLVSEILGALAAHAAARRSRSRYR